MITRFVVLCPIALVLAAITGCGADNLSEGRSIAQDNTAVSGMVHGGEQPVAGATVTLYAPGLTGYGSSPTVLVTATSANDGSFSLPRPYSCPATNDILTYITSTGGDSGSGPNSAIALVAVLGPCSSLSASSYIVVNEASTVAAAYALAPFAAISGSTTAIGTSVTNLLGLKNALGPASNMVDLSTGNARAVAELPAMYLPTAEVNTLADILAACVDTSGSTIPTAACGELFFDATPPGGSAPNDTFQAALDIALNPGNNAASLYSLSSATAPFQPTLTSTPGDFALAIQYVGGQIYSTGITTGLAIDAQGNAWVGNGGSNISVNEISPAGVFLSPQNGFVPGIAGGQGFSIDQNGNVFIAVASLNEVIELNSSGALINTFTPASLSGPTGLAVNNRDGSVWTADTDNTPSLNFGNPDFIGANVTNVTSTGVEAPGSPYGGNNGPFGVQIDASGDIWVANAAANRGTSEIGFITKYTPPAVAGNPYTAQSFTAGLYSFPFELAFDNSGNVWVTDNSTVGEYSNSGVLLSGTGYASNPDNSPFSIMIDGLGRAFVSMTNNSGVGGSLCVFSNNGTLISTANGLQGYYANYTIPYTPAAPTGLAIDPSGNVWISGYNDTSSVYGFVTEIIGIAAPVTTPTSVASSTNKYGVRP